jgi:hypothetical protein
MKRMGIEALYRKPNTSKPALGNKIYPYLLRGLKVERPNLDRMTPDEAYLHPSPFAAAAWSFPPPMVGRRLRKMLIRRELRGISA